MKRGVVNFEGIAEKHEGVVFFPSTIAGSIVLCNIVTVEPVELQANVSVRQLT